jgi:type I restriction enzyme S subunit
MKWPLDVLGNHVDLVMGQAPPGKDCNKNGNGTVFVKAGEFSDRYPQIREWTTKPLKFAKSGDVLVCVVGATAGKVNDAIDCAIGRSVAAVRPDSRTLDHGYLYHFLQVKCFELRAESQGLAQGVITREMLNRLSMPLPPLDEQRRIAGILDQADALRRLRARALDKLGTLGQAIFHEMFGGPQREYRKLGSFCERVTKGESPKWQGYGYQSEGPLFVTSESVGWGSLKLISEKRIPLSFHQKLLRSQLRRGDLLVNLVGASIGRACAFNLDEAANINQAVAVLSLYPEFRNLQEYLLTYLLSSEGQSYLLGSRVEGARANISLSDLREMPVPNPTEKLIVEFAGHFYSLQKNIALSQQSLTTSHDLFTSLQHRAFRGEL